MRLLDKEERDELIEKTGIQFSDAFKNPRTGEEEEDVDIRIIEMEEGEHMIVEVFEDEDGEYGFVTEDLLIEDIDLAVDAFETLFGDTGLSIQPIEESELRDDLHIIRPK